MSPFSTKKHLKTFEYRTHWNMNIRKNKFLYENLNSSAGWNKNPEGQHYLKKSIKQCQYSLCGVTFVKKNSCVVARIVLLDTADLHLL